MRRCTIRVHPDIPDLIDFEVNFNEYELKTGSHLADHPAAFERWKNNEPDNSIDLVKPIEPPPVLEIDLIGRFIVDKFQFIFMPRRYRAIKLIRLLQWEIKEHGFKTEAKQEF